MSILGKFPDFGVLLLVKMAHPIFYSMWKMFAAFSDSSINYFPIIICLCWALQKTKQNQIEIN